MIVTEEIRRTQEIRDATQFLLQSLEEQIAQAVELQRTLAQTFRETEEHLAELQQQKREIEEQN